MNRLAKDVLPKWIQGIPQGDSKMNRFAKDVLPKWI